MDHRSEPDDSSDAGTGGNPAGVLNRRYLVVLGLVALLVLLNQSVVQPSLLRLMPDAPLINVAGRQRMLSQRLAKAALALDAATVEAERTSRRNELATVLGLWSTSHDGLYDQEKSQARR